MLSTLSSYIPNSSRFIPTRIANLLRSFSLSNREVSVATKIPTMGELFRVDLNRVAPEFIEGLINAEKVIKITGREDLEIRTGSKNPNQFIIAKRDPDDPNKALFSVQVILSHGLVTDLDAILNGTHKPDGSIDSATLYTVSTWDSPKARGKGGEFIVEVAELIMRVMPNIQHIGTHSPLSGEDPNPEKTHFTGFADWVKRMPVEMLPAVNALITPQVYPVTFSELQERLKAANSVHDLMHDKHIENALRQLASLYATKDKIDSKGRFSALDQVAAFHLRNGAMIWDINPWAHRDAAGADKSFRESFGFKISYRYPRKNAKLVLNAGAYSSGKLARSAAIDSLLGPHGHLMPRAISHSKPVLIS